MTNLKYFLKKIPMFSKLDKRTLKQLADISIVESFSKDSRIVNEGDTSNELYIVLKGRADAVKFFDSETNIKLNTLLCGDHFGEMSFIDNEPRSATIIAREDTDVLVVPRKGFADILPENVNVSSVFIKGILNRLRKTTNNINDLMMIVAQQELQDAHIDTVRRLVLAAEHKDEQTGDHLNRISKISEFIAMKMGLPQEEIAFIKEASPMHDIGKIGIPEYILQKPGKLTSEEFEIMKTHTTIGAKILAKPKSELLQYSYQIALHHHEKFNGKGYPKGLKGENIPLSARIVALADVYDALRSERSYKKAFTIEKTLDIIKSEKGEHFDPDVVNAFLDNFEEFIAT